MLDIVCSFFFSSSKKHAWVNWQTFLASCYIGPLLPDEEETEAKKEEEA